MNIFVQEDYVNETQDLRLGSSEVFESRFKTKSEVYKYCLKTHGRCVGKVYIGKETPIAIGWIFQKLVKYEDANEKYLQSVWVTLHKGLPTRSIKYDYLESKDEN